MTKWLEMLAGFNPAVAIVAARFGPRRAAHLARQNFVLAAPFSDPVPEVTLDQILGERKAHINLRVSAYEDGMLPLRDAVALLSIVVAEQPRTIVEIGTFMGHTARAMAENVPGATVHTIDLPPDFSAETETKTAIPKDDYHLIAKRQVGREFKGTEFEKSIVQHFGDTAQLDFQQFGRPSFFFIDGSHTYEYCKNDSEKCLEIAAPGSTFLWHDCDAAHEGVLRFLREWNAKGRDASVIHGTALGYWKL